MCVNGHPSNTAVLNNLADEIEDIQTGQTDIYSALAALETNLDELVAGIGDEKEEPGAKIGAESKTKMTTSKLRNFSERLKALEENVKSIKSYVDGERKLDEILTELTTNKLEDVDEQIIEIKRLTNASKNEVKVSLGNVGVILKSVEDTADTRNFHLGGAIFYGGHGCACVRGNEECRDTLMECRAGQCQCIPGLSYDRKTRSCVKYCDFYGPDFEVVPNYVIRGNNSAVYENVSLRECRQMCINTTDFECVTFDYFNRFDACYLSEVTKLEEVDQWEYNGVGSHFQRNCD